MKTDEATTLPALTCLSKLQIYNKEGATMETLTRLHALKDLRVDFSEGDDDVQGFRLLPPGMTQLTQLAVHGESCTFMGLVSLIASLSSLASLVLPWRPCPMATLTRAPLQGLRQLSIAITEGSSAGLGVLCASFTGLGSVSVDIGGEGAAMELFQFLPQLTRLTALRICNESKIRDGVPADFLTRLTGLTELALCFVLSEHNVEADIHCLALLTRLRRLSLWSTEQYTLRYEDQVAEVPRSPVLVDRNKFEPLRALRWLEAWDLNNA